MQTNVILDQRLQKVVSYIPQGAVLADIGSDHAFVPCYCIQQNLIERAIAGEVNVGPMEAAQGQVALVQLEDKVDVRLGSGLTVLTPGEVTAVTIAGMGGTLIASILEEGKTHLSGEERLILQPNVDAVDVRKWLLANDYALLSEAIVKENEKIYEILVAEKGEESLYSDDVEQREWELYFGPQLTREKAPAFIEKWQTEKQKRQYILEQMQRGNDSDVLQGKIANIERLIQKMEEVTN